MIALGLAAFWALVSMGFFIQAARPGYGFCFGFGALTSLAAGICVFMSGAI